MRPAAIHAAEAVAMAVWLARQGVAKAEIRRRVANHAGYDFGRTLEAIRPHYCWSAASAESVPEAILCFLEADDFEQAVRNAVSLGGDADSMACIAGGIAAANWGGIPADIAAQTLRRLTPDLIEAVKHFSARCATLNAAVSGAGLWNR